MYYEISLWWFTEAIEMLEEDLSARGVVDLVSGDWFPIKFT